MYVITLDEGAHTEWQLFVREKDGSETPFNVIFVSDWRPMLATAEYMARLESLTTKRFEPNQLTVRRYYPAYLYCSKCGGEFDSEGWCSNYCLEDDSN